MQVRATLTSSACVCSHDCSDLTLAGNFLSTWSGSCSSVVLPGSRDSGATGYVNITDEELGRVISRQRYTRWRVHALMHGNQGCVTAEPKPAAAQSA